MEDKSSSKFRPDVGSFEAFWEEFGFDQKDPELMRILKSNLGGAVARVIEEDQIYAGMLSWSAIGGASNKGNDAFLAQSSADYLNFNRFGTMDSELIGRFYNIKSFIDELKIYLVDFMDCLEVNEDIIEDARREVEALYLGEMPLNFDQQIFGSEMVFVAFYYEFPEYRQLLRENESLCMDLMNLFYLRMVVRGKFEDYRQEVVDMFRAFLIKE